MTDNRGFLKALGPGLLFAATSVGVSHLVQSTRAGALYGLALLGAVILANVVKYPAFRFGPHYSAATGTSLLEGYRKQGKWALWLYAGVTVATMFAIQAAVIVVTAGLAIATLHLDVSGVTMSATIMAVCAGLLALGQYRWLDKVTKGLVVVLTLTTLASTLLVLGRVDWSQGWFPTAEQWADDKTVFFTAAVVGWMPSAIDIAVWSSLWTIARRNDTGYTPSLRESMLDFHIGYIATAVFAACFVIMGAGTMYGTGVTFESSAGKFAAQVIAMYTQTLGDWSRYLIGPAAFAVMFSTSLSVVDGFPRALAALVERFSESEDIAPLNLEQPRSRRVYWLSAVILAVGSLGILVKVPASGFKAMIDVATTLSFLTAPILAYLNHRAVMGAEVPGSGRPRPWLAWASRLSILCLTLFALYFLWLRYVKVGVAG